MKHIIASLILLASVSIAGAQVRPVVDPLSQYLTYDEALNSIKGFAETLPSELQKTPGPAQKTAWDLWEKQSDQSIRARLAQGDEDSIINLLLFGTSFTKQPRLTFAQIQKADAATSQLLHDRVVDLIAGVDKPLNSERLNFARKVLVDKFGYRTDSDPERARLAVFLLTSLQRVFQENDKYKQILNTARQSNDPTTIFAERSSLFRTRGLSSDTNTQPNFAIEEALKELKAKGVLTAKDVKRIGIVGPGLDFTDKQEGFDFYPLQTIQPFAFMDSLIKLGLADKQTLRLTTLDISPRINFHIRNARSNAQAGRSYLVHLPKDKTVNWTPDFIKFYADVGKQIGHETPASNKVDFADIRVIEISPEILKNVSAADDNIVLQNLKLAPQDRFDIIIATNIMVYYNPFEQSLAMVNLEKMLQPGGIFLCNNAMPELPATNLHSIGSTAAAYSSRANDGDVIVWYQKGK